MCNNDECGCNNNNHNHNNNNNNNNNNGHDGIRCALEDVCEINNCCESILSELNGIRRNTSSRNIRNIRREAQEIEEEALCIVGDIKDVDSNQNREPLKIISEGICDIREGLDDIEEGLRKIRCNNVCEGIREVREGVNDIQEGAHDIEEALNSITFNNNSSDRDCFIDINIRINKNC